MKFYKNTFILIVMLIGAVNADWEEAGLTHAYVVSEESPDVTFIIENISNKGKKGGAIPVMIFPILEGIDGIINIINPVLVEINGISIHDVTAHASGSQLVVGFYNIDARKQVSDILSKSRRVTVNFGGSKNSFTFSAIGFSKQFKRLNGFLY